MGVTDLINEILDSRIEYKIAWGAGNYYSNLRGFLNSLGVKYIYDSKWTEAVITVFDNKKVIYPSEIERLEKCIIIVCIYDMEVAIQLKAQFEDRYKNAHIYLLRELSPIGRNISKKEILLNSIKGKYIDHGGNTILFETESSLDKVEIRFNGENALITLGENVRIVNSLYIECGNETKVTIGNNTSFDKTIIFSAYANIEIGNDCMFSYDVYLRNHDSHFIFDKTTGGRINYGKSIEIKDHVWVGQNSILLPGVKVGEGSVVGAGCITSSSFPNNVVIAGNPGRVIRKEIEWDRKTTWINNFDHIEELRDSII